MLGLSSAVQFIIQGIAIGLGMAVAEMDFRWWAAKLLLSARRR
jgi:hypothetical protein